MTVAVQTATHPDSLGEIFADTFEGHPLTRIELRGRPCYVATEIGAALEYAHPRRFSNRMRGEWAAEMREGEDFDVLAGESLKLFKELCTRDVYSFAPSLTVLYESGIKLALLKTRKPAGQRLRRHLVDRGLKTLAEAEAKQAPAAPPRAAVVDPAAERERRLMAREARLMRQVEARERALQLKALQHLTASARRLGIEERVVHAVEVRSTAEITGLDVAALLPVLEPEPELTPTEIAKRFGVTPNRIGRTITACGLREPDAAHLRTQYMDHAPGRPTKTFPAFRWKPEAVKRIRQHLVAGGHVEA